MTRDARGFTLLEVLVTLVIVAMFSSVVYAVFLQAVADTRYTEESVLAGLLIGLVYASLWAGRRFFGFMPGSAN